MVHDAYTMIHDTDADTHNTAICTNRDDAYCRTCGQTSSRAVITCESLRLLRFPFPFPFTHAYHGGIDGDVEHLNDYFAIARGQRHGLGDLLKDIAGDKRARHRAAEYAIKNIIKDMLVSVE